MDAVYSWAAAVTICSVIACIVEMLTSNSSMEKTVRFVLGLFMLCVIIAPLTSVVQGIGGIDFDMKYEYECNDDMQETQIKLLQNEIGQLVEKTLAQSGIKPLVTEIKMDIDDSGNIDSVKADITIQQADAEKAAKAEEIILTELGIECTVKA